MKAPTTLDYDANPEIVEDFDRLPRLFIPGYDASHAIAAVLLQEHISHTAHILAIGGGGGNELAHFADVAPNWQFTAVDPSIAMLKRAEDKLAKRNAQARLTPHAGLVDTAPTGPFDAATAFLVLHFVPDDGSRLAQMRAIHARLRPGAPFLLINGATSMQGPDFERDLQRYAAHAINGGADAALVASALEMHRTALHFVSPERERALLQEAGFHTASSFYQALWFHGWIAFA